MKDKLLKIQMELKAPKSNFNKFGNYNYRNCEDILEAVKPLCEKYKCVLTISDTVESIGNRIYVKSTAILQDIDETNGIKFIEVDGYAREPETKKGFDESQLTGAASSYARKYALNGLFAIDDNKDADNFDNSKYDNKSVEKPLGKVLDKDDNELLKYQWSVYTDLIESYKNILSIEDKKIHEQTIACYNNKQMQTKDINKAITFYKSKYGKMLDSMDNKIDNANNDLTNAMEDK